jgi:hypothetical protein
MGPQTEDGGESVTPENRVRAQKASLERNALALADQLAQESAGRDGATPNAAAVATLEQDFQALQDFQVLVATAAANWLVFDDPAPPAPPAPSTASLRSRASDGMFGDVGGRPTDGTVH